MSWNFAVQVGVVCYNELQCRKAPLRIITVTRAFIRIGHFIGGSGEYIFSNLDAKLISQSWHSALENILAKIRSRIKLSLPCIYSFSCIYSSLALPPPINVDFINEKSCFSLLLGGLNAHSPDRSFRAQPNIFNTSSHSYRLHHI